MNIFEKICAAILVLVPSVGHFLARWDFHFFDYVYIGEDHVIETMTAVFLIFCAILCFYRITKLWHVRTKLFLACTLFAALGCIFGAGEEMSWGQRFLGLETPEILKKYNNQGEINLHNIKIGDFNVNKVIFSQLMSLGLVFYFLFLPFLYRKKDFWKRWVNRMAIPIAKNWHTIIFMTSILIASQIPAQRRWELLEFAGTFMFFLIFMNPVNKEIFQKNMKKI